MPFFELNEVTYRAGGRLILDRFTLQVQAGETFVLLGRSGSGKTTALRLLNGLLTPGAGTVIIDGRPIANWNLEELRHRTGFVLQDAGLFPHFTVEQNIGLVPGLLGWTPDRIHARVREMMAMVQLSPELLQRRPHQLSAGQKQRTGLARALAADPPALLMDEPYAALDPMTRQEVRLQFQSIIRQLAKTCVLVTHDAREAFLLADRIGLVHNGRLELALSPAEFQRSAHPEAQAFVKSAA